MTKQFRLVDTDNFGGDYPAEKWACIGTFNNIITASNIADVLNEALNPDETGRYIKVVTLPYELQGGMETLFAMKTLPKAYEDNHEELRTAVTVAWQAAPTDALETRWEKLGTILDKIKQDIKDFNS